MSVLRLLVLVAGPGAPAVALAQAALVTGTVTQDGDRPVPYARVVLLHATRPDSVVRETLAGANGSVGIGGVAAGRYRVQVRQIGYAPAVLDLTVAGGDPPALRVQLARIAMVLPTVVVTAAPSCDAPEMRAGRDDPRLAALLATLVENSARYEALHREYPIQGTAVVRRAFYTAAGAERGVVTDTTRGRLHTVKAYAPASVVTRRRSARGQTVGFSMDLPEFGSIGSDAFVRSHCFAYGGEAELGGTTTLRLLFAPEERIRTPDVAGVFYLDPVTGVIRRSELTLVGLWKNAPFSDVAVTVDYAEILPSLVLEQSVLLTQRLTGGQKDDGVPLARKEQTIDLLAYGFIGAAPGSIVRQ